MSGEITCLGTLTISSAAVPANIVFPSAQPGKPAVTIKPDGSVELGEGVTNDEAAKAFWDAVIRMNPWGRRA